MTGIVRTREQAAFRWVFFSLMLLGVASSTTLDREFVWEHVRRDHAS